MGAQWSAEKMRREQDRKDKELQMKREQMQRDSELERQKREYERKQEEDEHKERLAKIARENKQQQHKFYVAERKRYQDEVKQLGEDQKKKVAMYNDQAGKLKLINANLTNKKQEIEADINRIDEEIATIAANFKNADKKISDAIEKTNVDEGNVPIFLRLVNNGLLFATLANTEQRQILCENIKTFSALLRRQSQEKWTIETEFEDAGLQKYIPALIDNDYTNMDDILCEDDEEFKTDFIEDVWSEMEIKGKDLRLLKKLLLRKKAEADKNGWMNRQKQKQDFVKSSMLELSPKLATFFGKINDAMADTQKALSYNPNDIQKQAIELSKENENTLKMLKEKGEKESIAEEDDDAKGNETVTAGPPPRSEQKEDEIANYVNNKIVAEQDFKKDELIKLTEANEAFKIAAIVKLHVVDDMRQEFQGGNHPITRESGLTLATNVEQCCMQVIETQAVIRKSVLLGKELIKYKPAQPSEKAIPLWDAIDKGIIDIFNNAIEMMKVSAQYFGYFIKFKQAYQYFSSTYEQNDGVDLRVALEYIDRDTKEFVKFQQEMQVTVDKLRIAAQETIKNCIKDTAGASEYETAMKKRDEAAKQLQQKRNELREKKFGLNQQYEKLRKDQIEQESRVASLKFEKEFGEKLIKRQQQLISHLDQKIKALNY